MKTWVKVVKGELTLQRHGSNDRSSPVIQETALAENSVLFFDDSYEHQAWNNCSDGEGGLPRVVLQVVVRHPRAPAD